jgi:UDP-glucose:(heptosyl)LPS alpha-1,3-glucosyltransferase
MKIALVRQRVAGPGGAETTLGYLARGLAAAGHRLVVLGTDREDAARAALGPGVDYVQAPAYGGKTGRLLSFALNARRLWPRHNPDVVLSLERTLGQQVYRAGDGCHREWLARQAPYLGPAGLAARRLSLFHAVLLNLEGRLFGHPGLKKVIANSRQVQGEIVRHYGLGADRMAVIYNGLDQARFKPLTEAARQELRRRLGHGGEQPIILFAGSGFRRKGLKYLLKAAARLIPRRFAVWVAGKGDAAPYRRLAQRLGLVEQVRFWGAQADLAPFYQVAAALALPTLYDPCSNVALEALGCGCPVVTTCANGAGEFITSMEAGEVLTRPDDLEGLAQALERFLESGHNDLTRQAAHEAVAHLSWDATVQQTLAVLQEAAGK